MGTIVFECIWLILVIPRLRTTQNYLKPKRGSSPEQKERSLVSINKTPIWCGSSHIQQESGMIIEFATSIIVAGYFCHLFVQQFFFQ